MSVYGASAPREGAGWFFGLTGPQVILVVITAAPCWLVLAAGRWSLLLAAIPAWAVGVALICVPIRGFSALQWSGVVVRSVIGRSLGWSRFQSRAAAGLAWDANSCSEPADLPGALGALEFHDGPPMAGTGTRVAIYQDHVDRTWGATGRIVHPGIGMSDESERQTMAAGLSEMLESSATSGEVATIALQIRTVPDDGVERESWVHDHQRPAPELTEQLYRQLDLLTAGAAVRTEAFISVVLHERAIQRDVRRSGGGIVGRARALYGHLDEIGARLVGTLGCSEITWLDSAELASSVRTGFEPGDAALLAESAGPAVPMAMAGPALASTAIRNYRHGDWVSVSSTLLLPAKGAALGALARVLTPSEPGERRALTVFFQPIPRRRAERATSRAGMSAAMAAEMRRRVGRAERARDRLADDVLRRTDEKLEHGRALVRLSTVASITVPGQWSPGEYARRLDSSIRLAGFTPLPLDGAHDSAFAAATIPLGTGLPRYRS